MLMKLFNFSKKTQDEHSVIYKQNTKSGTGSYVTEALKGLVSSNKKKFPQELGEEHPFDYSVIEGLTKHFGVVNAIIDKHIDFIMSSGINVASEDERSKTIIEEWMSDVNFNSNIRPWLKEALGKGTGYLELGTDGETIDEMKTLKSDFMYIDRDDVGKLKAINQYTKPLTKGFNKSNINPLDEKNVAILKLNVLNDMAYGLGIIYPMIRVIDDLLGSRKEMHTLMERKANNPLFFIMGDKTQNKYPTKAQMDDMGSQLEWLNNKHEWVISDFTKPMSIDFGNVGDKFEKIIDSDLEILYMAAQIPAFLMGKASIAEGLAKEQMKAFMYRIQSLREEIEKVIEEKIFKRILNVQGLETHVEIIWGVPSQEDKNTKVTLLNELLKNPFLTEAMKNSLEIQMAQLLDIPEDDIMTEQEEREDEEDNELLPVVPQQRSDGPSATPRKQNQEPAKKEEHIHEHIHLTESEMEHYDNMTVSEWTGFQYGQYSQDVIDVVMRDSFSNLKGVTKTDFKAGLLNTRQIEQLRTSLQEAYEKNLTITQLKSLLNKRIDFTDRLIMKNGKLKLSKNGKPIVSVAAKKRAIMIARTETTRTANLGAVENYKKNDVKEVRWIAGLSERTCPICEDLNGRIYNINSIPPIPAHVFCRCTLGAVIR